MRLFAGQPTAAAAACHGKHGTPWRSCCAATTVSSQQLVGDSGVVEDTRTNDLLRATHSDSGATELLQVRRVLGVPHSVPHTCLHSESLSPTAVGVVHGARDSAVPPTAARAATSHHMLVPVQVVEGWSGGRALVCSSKGHVLALRRAAAVGAGQWTLSHTGKRGTAATAASP